METPPASTGVSSPRSIPFTLDRPRAAVFWSCPECFSASLIQSRGLEVLSSRPRHAQPSADWAQRKRITLGQNDVMARAQVLSH